MYPFLTATHHIRHIRIKNHIKQTTPVLVYMYIIIIFVIKITGDLFAVSFPKNTPKNGCHDLGTLLPLVGCHSLLNFFAAVYVYLVNRCYSTIGTCNMYINR